MLSTTITPDRDRTLLLAVVLIMTVFFVGVAAYDHFYVTPHHPHLSARK